LSNKSYLTEPPYRHVAFKLFTGCLTAIGEKVFRRENEKYLDHLPTHPAPYLVVYVGPYTHKE